MNPIIKEPPTLGKEAIEPLGDQKRIEEITQQVEKLRNKFIQVVEF